MFDLTSIIFLCLTGIFTGFCAGLFGIGGGGIMVPLLALCFAWLQFPEQHLLHYALGTSMAAIIPTAVASIISHQRHHAILWPIVFKLSPGLLIGTFAGAAIASYLSTFVLAIFFSIFMAIVAKKMWNNNMPKASRQLPSSSVIALTGGGIGCISALVAIGGGTMTVPFLLWCNVHLRNAIATSAAAGLPIAITGATGYAIHATSDLGNITLGYIVWPAVLSLAAGSVLTAPLGAKLAHKLPTEKLKKYFAIFLLFLSVQMLMKVVFTPS
jgi:uncharacterized membrane protein YfcA